VVVASSNPSSLTHIVDGGDLANMGRGHGDAGAVLMPSVMPRMSRTPASISWAGRALGVDTEQVISEWLDGGTARQLSGEESTLSA